MSVTIRHVRIAAGTGSGSQTITSSDGPGTTPVAALFYLTRGTGATEVELQLCMGATDGSNSRCSLISSEDNVEPSNTWSKALNDSVLMTVDPNTGTMERYATFSSFGTDSVTISWSASGSAYLMTVILFWGTDINVAVGDFDGGGSSVSLGFRPEQIFTFGQIVTNFTSNSTTSSTADGSISIGILTDQNGILNQSCIGCYIYDNKSSGSNFSLSIIDKGAIFDDAAVAFSTLTPTSSGFNISGTGGYIGYLAISYNNQVSMSVNDDATPTSTGDVSVTTGFKPQFVFELQSNCTAYNTVSSSKNQFSFGIGVYTNSSSDDHCSFWRHFHESPGATISKIRSTTNFIEALRDPGVVYNINARFSTADLTGYTKNYIAVDSTARKNILTCVGETIPHGWMDEARPLPAESDEVVSYG